MQPLKAKGRKRDICKKGRREDGWGDCIYVEDPFLLWSNIIEPPDYFSKMGFSLLRWLSDHGVRFGRLWSQNEKDFSRQGGWKTKLVEVKSRLE